jgi:hypothetical protein
MQSTTLDKQYGSLKHITSTPDFSEMARDEYNLTTISNKERIKQVILP